MDKEKKIAEIREWHDGKRDSFPPFTVFEAIGCLIDELDRLEREYAEERAAHNAHMTELCQLEEETRKLREERDKLIEVLRWYADTKNYEYRTSYLDQDAPIIDDSGQRARDILKEIGVTVE